jgi:hypothetical protein
MLHTQRFCVLGDLPLGTYPTSCATLDTIAGSEVFLYLIYGVITSEIDPEYAGLFANIY